MITPFLEFPELDSVLLRDVLVPGCLLSSAVRASPAGPDGLVRTDMLIRDGVLAAIGLGLAGDDPVLALAGEVSCWPGLHDIHTHLDKGHIWARSPNADGSFGAALAATASDRERFWTREDMERRMEFALASAFAHGTVAIRTHLDTVGSHRDVVWPLFREVQARWQGRIALQAAALCTLPQLRGAEGDAIARQVADTEGGVLGGLVMRAPWPEGALAEALDPLFRLAARFGLDLDLHVDENDDAGGTGLEEVARAVLRHRFRGRVLCGHCCSLAVQPEDRRRDTIALVAEAGLGVVSLPMCNLYLQDRAPGRTPRWRGITLLHELAEAGVPVMLSSDNTRDPFYAFGDLDMLEVFREAVRIAHLDHPFGDWPSAVTTRPAGWMGRDATLAPGRPADLVLFDAASLNELLSRPQADRLVLRRGRPAGAVPPRFRSLDRPHQSGCPR